MKIHLMRIDKDTAQTPISIEIGEGPVPLGRGSLLDIEEPYISRSHVELRSIVGGVLLKCKHRLVNRILHCC